MAEKANDQSSGELLLLAVLVLLVALIVLRSFYR